MATISARAVLRTIPRGILLKFCLFWGIPCRMPITRANDDLIFLKACACAKWKSMFHQKLPIYLMMAPVWAIIIFSNNEKAVVLMWYLLPLVLVGAIGLIAGTVSATSGSFDIQTRNAYVRLQKESRMAAEGLGTMAVLTATDLTQRMQNHLERNPFSVPMPPRRVGRPA